MHTVNNSLSANKYNKTLVLTVSISVQFRCSGKTQELCVP